MWLNLASRRLIKFESIFYSPHYKKYLKRNLSLVDLYLIKIGKEQLDKTKICKVLHNKIHSLCIYCHFLI